MTASIDYRINKTMMADDPETSMLWAAHDAKAAVRFLRKNAAKLRVDTDRIGAFGSSAGAMTVIFMSAVASEGDSGNAGFSSAIRAGVSLSGALACIEPGNDCRVTANISSKTPPFLDFHGCEDPTVPYACHNANCWGSGVDTVAALTAAGAKAWLYSFPGQHHVPWGSLAAAGDTFVHFLTQHMDLAGAQCPKAPASDAAAKLFDDDAVLSPAYNWARSPNEMPRFE